MDARVGRPIATGDSDGEMGLTPTGSPLQDEVAPTGDELRRQEAPHQLSAQRRLMREVELLDCLSRSPNPLRPDRPSLQSPSLRSLPVRAARQ